MRQLLIPMCLALVVTHFHVSPVAACINDSETGRTEQEFKKNYEFKSGYTSEPTSSYESPTPADQKWVSTAAMGSGAGFLVLAAGLMKINFCKLRRR